MGATPSSFAPCSPRKARRASRRTCPLGSRPRRCLPRAAPRGLFGSSRAIRSAGAHAPSCHLDRCYGRCSLSPRSGTTGCRSHGAGARYRGSPARVCGYDRFVDQDERVNERVRDARVGRGFKDVDAHHRPDPGVLEQADLPFGCIALSGHRGFLIAARAPEGRVNEDDSVALRRLAHITCACNYPVPGDCGDDRRITIR